MRLYVNIDHVATLREARRTDEPDPVRAAAAAERAGADGITVHLREDRRHIQDADVRARAASVGTVLNLELGAAPEIVRIASRIAPFQATLVPERRQEITTEGGLALHGTNRKVGAAVRRLVDAGIRVSLFIDPDRATIDRAAAAAERAGADGITVHLREDRRHIQDADVRALAASVGTVLNLELGAAPEIVRIASRIAPFQATLVPERRQEITTEGGLALHGTNRKVGAAVRRLVDAGIRVSLFIDPDRATIDRAAALGVPAIELHTGRYAHTWRKSDAALRALERAAGHARARGLAVHAGHGLTYENVQPVAALPDIEELNIGHSIVSNAVYWGMEEAVRRMRQLVDAARKA